VDAWEKKYHAWRKGEVKDSFTRPDDILSIFKLMWRYDELFFLC
jgi:hypothetical protein